MIQYVSYFIKVSYTVEFFVPIKTNLNWKFTCVLFINGLNNDNRKSVDC